MKACTNKSNIDHKDLSPKNWKYCPICGKKLIKTGSVIVQ